ncbi:Agamous-like MADS-box protein AGL62, partial [Mucuna pruriens]
MSHSEMSSAKKSRGRQKIEMKKMSNESNLQVTFSKRRSGLFKKASELCTLCGADVALVVFSPGEKVFSFGHPNVDAVIDRYMARAPPPNSGTMQFIEAHRIANVNELNAQLTQINNQLDAERKRGEELDRLKKAAQAQLWWARPIDEMTKPQLDQYKAAMEELKKHVARLADRTILQSAVNPPQFYPGASSSSNIAHQPQPQPPPQPLPQSLPPLPPQVFPPQPQSLTPLPSQLFPPQLIQPSMLQNYMFVDGTLMNHHGFNDMGMGGFGPAGDKVSTELGSDILDMS